MIDKDDPGLIKLDSKNKAAVYDLLFGKATDNLKSAKDIALLYLGSPYYAKQVLEEYNNIKKVNIFTTAEFKFIYEPFEKEQNYRIWYVEDPKDTFKECDMKFDCIIMNPPYQKNLHLKILAEAIKHLKDDNSVCVNVSPDTWLYTFADVNKRSDYNKFSNLPFKEIYRLGLLNKYFDLGHTTYTGAIYVCSKNEKPYNIENELYSDIILVNNKIMPKILNKKIKDILVNFISKYSSLEENIKTGCPDINTKWTRYIPRLVGNPGDRCSCLASIGSERWDKNFYKGVFNGKTYSETKKKLSNVKNYSDFDHVEFNTENEANNWRDSNNTFFMRYVCTLVHVDSHRHAQWMPWLGDAINPRTGLKGYKGEWTNDDLYKFFNITPEEQKVIEETMAKYK